MAPDRSLCPRDLNERVSKIIFTVIMGLCWLMSESCIFIQFKVDTGCEYFLKPLVPLLHQNKWDMSCFFFYVDKPAKKVIDSFPITIRGVCLSVLRCHRRTEN